MSADELRVDGVADRTTSAGKLEGVNLLRAVKSAFSPELATLAADKMVWADLSGTALRVSARVNHSLTAVPDRADASESAPTSGRIYLFGGDDGQSPRRDAGHATRDEWEEPELRGERPSPRSRHSMTLVRHFRAETQTEDERLYLYGGVGTHTEVVHYLDLATRTWVTPTPVGEEVLPLLGHTAAAIGAEAWVFGGRDARRSYNHVWKLDTTTHEWASFRGAHAPTGMVPPPSSKHVMSVQGTKLLVVLGELPPEKVFLYETTSNAWLQAAVANPQGAPELHRGAAAFIGEELHVFGGLDVAANNPTNTMHLLDTRVMEWHTAAAGGATPTERVGPRSARSAPASSSSAASRPEARTAHPSAGTTRGPCCGKCPAPTARRRRRASATRSPAWTSSSTSTAARAAGGRSERCTSTTRGRVTGRRRSPTWRRCTATRRARRRCRSSATRWRRSTWRRARSSRRTTSSSSGRSCSSSAAATAARRHVTRGSST